jgi:hypothetical protein
MIDKSIGTVYPASLPDPASYWYMSNYYVTADVAQGSVIWKGGVKSGYEANGGPPLFLCSVYYQDGYQIGKFRPGFPGCDISYGGQEVHVNSGGPNFMPFYDVGLGWMENPEDQNGWSGGAIPIDQPVARGLYQSAIIGGQEQDGTSLYLCFAQIDDQNGNVPGKLRPGLGGCSIAWQGKEYIISPYTTLGETYSKTPPPAGPR